MNAKSIALTVTFAAVAIALNAVRIPAVFYPGNFYQFSQIPVVAAFLLFGVKIGVLVGVLNLAGALALLPFGPGSIIVYPMDFVSLLLMFAGLYLAIGLMKRGHESKRNSIWKKPGVVLTAFAIAFRGGIMPFIDYWLILRVLAPLVLGVVPPGVGLARLALIFVLYNVTVALYVVPIAYLVATNVSRHLRMDQILVKVW